MEDLAGLPDDLHLLLVVALGVGLPAARDDVVGQLVRVDVDGRLLTVGDGSGLVGELVDESFARA